MILIDSRVMHDLYRDTYQASSRVDEESCPGTPIHDNKKCQMFHLLIPDFPI